MKLGLLNYSSTTSFSAAYIYCFQYSSYETNNVFLFLTEHTAVDSMYREAAIHAPAELRKSWKNRIPLDI